MTPKQKAADLVDSSIKSLNDCGLPCSKTLANILASKIVDEVQFALDSNDSGLWSYWRQVEKNIEKYINSKEA